MSSNNLGYLSQKKILLASLQNWQHPLLSKHYITLELAKQDNQLVFFCFERFFKEQANNRYLREINFNTITDDNIKPVTVRVPPGFMKNGFLRFMTKMFTKAQCGIRYSPDIVILFDPQFFLINDLYDNAFKIYYCVDHVASNRVLKEAETKMLSKVDCVVTASVKLYNDYKEKHNRVYLVPHGVNLLREYEDLELKEKVEGWFKKCKAQKVLGYIGNISYELDFELIEFIAKRNEDCIIVLIGPVSPEVSQTIASLPDNVKFMDAVPTIGVKYCLQYFDVGLVPYVKNTFNTHRNPIKILQYLSAGIPVVSTEIGLDYGNEDFVIQANDHSDFDRKLKSVNNKKPEEMTRERKNYGQTNSWSERVKLLEKILVKY